MHVSPVLLDCNFIVDSTNGNGLGIRSLKGPAIKDVFMHTSATPAPGNPNPSASSGPPPGSPNLGRATSFEILASSTITNTGSTVVTGNLGLSPGTSVTGFPPGTVIGVEHITDTAAANAQTDATAAYTDLQGRSPGTTESDLSGLTLAAGTYTSGSTMSIAVGQTLTLDAAGDPNAVWIFQVGSAVTFNTSSSVVIINGGSAANVYWQVGSSATLGVSSNIVGTIIAESSVTLDTGAILNGRAFALTGSVTMDTNTATLVPAPALGGGVIIVDFVDSYNRSLSGFNAIVSPLSGSPVTSVIAGNAYVIVSLGTASLAQWQAKGLPVGFTPELGTSFIATASGSIGGSAAVDISDPAGSGITNIETIGDPNATIDNTDYQTGARLILQCYSNGVQASPANGTVISLGFLLSNSSIVVQGE